MALGLDLSAADKNAVDKARQTLNDYVNKVMKERALTAKDLIKDDTTELEVRLLRIGRDISFIVTTKGSTCLKSGHPVWLYKMIDKWDSIAITSRPMPLVQACDYIDDYMRDDIHNLKECRFFLNGEEYTIARGRETNYITPLTDEMRRMQTPLTKKQLMDLITDETTAIRFIVYTPSGDYITYVMNNVNPNISPLKRYKSLCTMSVTRAKLWEGFQDPFLGDFKSKLLLSEACDLIEDELMYACAGQRKVALWIDDRKVDIHTELGL